MTTGLDEVRRKAFNNLEVSCALMKVLARVVTQSRPYGMRSLALVASCRRNKTPALQST